MTDYANKKVVVVGAGRSGLGLARFFQSRGAQVILSDQRRASELTGLGPLAESGVVLDLGGHDAQLFASADLLALSPGVPLEITAIRDALAKGVPVAGEVEIAWRELHAPLIGITGTNGKSTVTSLIGAMLSRWGKRTFVGGNLGTPLVEAIDQEWEWLVVELSSFQLEAITSLRPRYGLLLNITSDHLDRYPDMASYRAAKLRIFENMGSGETAVLNADDPQVAEVANTIGACIVWFSTSRVPQQGIGLDGGALVWRWQGQEARFPVDQLQLTGRHNLENVMAALVPLLLEGCPSEIAWSAARDFRGLPHRMELVGERNGVRWYDDSKGTNVGSVAKSLAGLEAPVTLIAGGRDKQGELSPLAEQVAGKVKQLILIGEAAERMAAAFADMTQIHRAPSMEEAVNLAERLTPPGGVVLLSPGCSSFDMFRNYQERGRAFVEAFQRLPAVTAGGDER
ncbi:MAG: UDP-N-acetylmuramoyl-L-alanine--D-glutamate ligase [Desulfuromonas sp.]|nr:MAG: UDP-N-acetylmuramoyl-L-alanine--D-glutamate ligase [Desulfuromonas sp.]